MLRHLPIAVILLLLTIGLVFLSLLSVTVGPMSISLHDSIQSLFFRSQDIATHVNLVIHQIRLPRTVLCLLVGAILAICGVVMQGLFRNPLAEPGIIGVSAGASLGAAIAIVALASWQVDNYWFGLLTLPFCAFVGGLLTTLFVYHLGTNQLGTSVTIMLLAGVAISALSGAGIGYLNFLADDQMLRDLTLWSMGSFAGANWQQIAIALFTLLVLIHFFYRRAMALNALLLGESEARHLGIAVQPLKRTLIVLCAAGVGVTVSVAGMIGFVGLVVPHLGRMLIGPDHRYLLPVSALLGALLLTCADMFARVAVAPSELPIGIVTALVGAPFFLYLLFKQRGKIY